MYPYTVNLKANSLEVKVGDVIVHIACNARVLPPNSYGRSKNQRVEITFDKIPNVKMYADKGVHRAGRYGGNLPPYLAGKLGIS